MRTIRNISGRPASPRRPPASGVSPLLVAAALALAGALAYPSLAGGGAGGDAPGPRDRAAAIVCPG